MSEDAKEKLYEQLLEMESANLKEEHVRLLSWEEYKNLTDAQALSYVFWYRDTQTYFERTETNPRTNEVTNMEQEYDIALPDMNFEGQNLSRTTLPKEIIGTDEDVFGIRLSRFVLKMQNENGAMQPTKVNLKDTGVEINVSLLEPDMEINDMGFSRYILDFSKCDFRGCNIFGILLDEYLNEEERRRFENSNVLNGLENSEAVKSGREFIVRGKEKLDEKYLERRKEHHLSLEEKKIADNAYKRLKKGCRNWLNDMKYLERMKRYMTIRNFRPLNGMKGVNSDIDLTDYDFSDFDGNILREIIEVEENSREYTRIYISFSGAKNSILGCEYSLESSGMQACRIGNFRFVEGNFDNFSGSVKVDMMQLVLEKGTQEGLDFIERHISELYESKNDSSYHYRSKFIKRIYNKLNDEEITEELRSRLYKMIDESFSGLGNEDIKLEILQLELEKGTQESLNFIERLYSNITLEGRIAILYDAIEGDFVRLRNSEEREVIIYLIKDEIFKLKDIDTKLEILESELKKGTQEGLDFIGHHISELYESKNDSSYQYRSNFIKKIYDKLNDEEITEELRSRLYKIINESFSGLKNEKAKLEILELELKKGTQEGLDFIGHHISELEEGKYSSEQYRTGFIKRIYDELSSEEISEERRNRLYKMVDETFSDLGNVDIKLEILQLELEKGTQESLNFIERHISELEVIRYSSYYYSRFIKRIYDKLNDEEISEERRNRLYKIIYENFSDLIHENTKLEILQLELEKGTQESLNFIERMYSNIALEGRIAIFYDAIDDDFVRLKNSEERRVITYTIKDKFFKLGDNYTKLEILETELKKGTQEGLDFIERHISGLEEDKENEYDGYKHRSIFIKRIYDKLNDEEISEERRNRLYKMVDETFSGLGNENIKLEILELELKKGTQEGLNFIERHISELEEVEVREFNRSYYSSYYRWDFIKKIYDELSSEEISEERRNRLYKIVDKSFSCSRIPKKRLEILETELKKGTQEGLDFIERHISELYESEASSYQYRSGFIKRIYDELSGEEISEERRNRLYKIIYENFSDLRQKDTKIKILQSEFNNRAQQSGEAKKFKQKIIQKVVEDEKKEVEMQGKKEVSKSGALLYELIKTDGNIDVINSLIEAGTNINYTAYRNINRNTPEYTPILYEALQIEEPEKRKQVVSLLLKAGVNLDCRYFKRDYSSDESVSINVMNANKGELRQIMQELNIQKGKDGRAIQIQSEKTTETVSQKEEEVSKTKKQTSEEIVTNYLSNTIGLDEEQIKSVATAVPSIMKKTVEGDLSLKQAMFDTFGVTKEVYSMTKEKNGMEKSNLIVMSPEVLYTRLKFYSEYGKKIGFKVNDKTFIAAMGMPNMLFLERCAIGVFEKGNMNRNEYANFVRKKLQEKYPMPKTKKEFEKEMQMIQKGLIENNSSDGQEI